jgi:hypothetical protein
MGKEFGPLLAPVAAPVAAVVGEAVERGEDVEGVRGGHGVSPCGKLVAPGLEATHPCYEHHRPNPTRLSGFFHELSGLVRIVVVALGAFCRLGERGALSIVMATEHDFEVDELQEFIRR